MTFCFFRDKKGEQLLSIWWFAVLVIVAGGIVFGVLIFYSSHVDIRALESKVLVDRITNCIDNKALENEEFLKGKEGNFDVLGNCKINKELFGKGSNYFIKISTSDKELYKFGNPSFEEQCQIKEGALRAKHFPECYERTISFSNQNDNLKINVLAGSNNQGEVIKK